MSLSRRASSSRAGSCKPAHWAGGDHLLTGYSGDYAGVKWINGSCLACDFCQQAGSFAKECGLPLEFH